MKERHYEIIDSVKVRFLDAGEPLRLHRIRATRDFYTIHGWVKAGTVGGLIESELNLVQGTNAWVADNSIVYGRAEVRDNALVYSMSRVGGDAKVYGEGDVDNSYVGQNASVYDKANVSNCAVTGDSVVCGEAVVDKASLYDRAKVCGKALIIGNVKLWDKAVVCAEARLFDSVVVGGTAVVGGSTKLLGHATVRVGRITNEKQLITEGPFFDQFGQHWHITFNLSSKNNIRYSCTEHVTLINRSGKFEDLKKWLNENKEGNAFAACEFYNPGFYGQLQAAVTSFEARLNTPEPKMA